MEKEIRLVFAERSNEFFDRLTLCFSVHGTGGRNRPAAVIFYGACDFFLAKIDQRADYRQIRSIQIGLRRKGRKLSRGKQAHEKGFHGVIQMMGIGDFFHAVFFGVAIDRAAPEIGAGEAGILSVLLSKNLLDVYFLHVMRNIEGMTEGSYSFHIKSFREHGVDGKSGEPKVLFETFSQDGKRVGKENAVLSSGDADQDVVFVFDQIEFNDGTHELAEIRLRQIDFHVFLLHLYEQGVFQVSKPIVAIVGRPNVGKSTLFNQIGKRRMSIVDDMPGVTRDRIYMDAEWLQQEFTMIDTGGIELEQNDHILSSIRQQAQLAMEEADVILFLVDGRAGLTSSDEEIAKLLRSAGKPVVLGVNKVDSPKQEMEIYEFYNLGLGDPIGISASNSLNLGDLLDAIVEAFPDMEEEPHEADEIRIAVIGRPNVGKSSIVNAVLGEDRVIVSDIPGTTRDAIDTHFTKDDMKFTLIDTAGMRRKGKIDEPVERYSVMRSLRAIDRADVVLMVINAEEGILEQDKKIAGYAHEAGKGTVIIVNKWDVFPDKDDKSTLRFTDDLREQLGFLQYAPVLYTSALTGQRINRITELVRYVAEQQSMRIKTSVLNDLIRDAVSVNPPPTHKGRQLKLLFMTQVGICPPKFVIFVNEPNLMHFSYLRFIENRLRESYGFEGTPLRLIVRNREEKEEL